MKYLITNNADNKKLTDLKVINSEELTKDVRHFPWTRSSPPKDVCRSNTANKWFFRFMFLILWISAYICMNTKYSEYVSTATNIATLNHFMHYNYSRRTKKTFSPGTPSSGQAVVPRSQQGAGHCWWSHRVHRTKVLWINVVMRMWFLSVSLTSSVFSVVQD